MPMLNTMKLHLNVFYSKYTFPLGIVILLFLIGLLTVCVPNNTDEFCHFHWLACKYQPNAIYNTFHDSFYAYKFNFMGLFSYYNSYYYAGPIQSILAYPFFY